MQDPWGVGDVDVPVIPPRVIIFCREIHLQDIRMSAEQSTLE